MDRVASGQGGTLSAMLVGFVRHIMQLGLPGAAGGCLLRWLACCRRMSGVRLSAAALARQPRRELRCLSLPLLAAVGQEYVQNTLTTMDPLSAIQAGAHLMPGAVGMLGWQSRRHCRSYALPRHQRARLRMSGGEPNALEDHALQQHADLSVACVPACAPNVCCRTSRAGARCRTLAAPRSLG